MAGYDMAAKMTIGGQLSADTNHEIRNPVRTLFVHCPKTGGTTLDSVLAANYAAWPMSRSLRFGFNKSDLPEIAKAETRYVSGHFPASIVDLGTFDDKLTILRSPLDLVCSTISFMGQVMDVHPRVLRALETGSRLEIYREYFSANFDLGRYLIEREYGLASDFFEYAEDCQPEDSVLLLKDFNRILDFDKLEAEIKHLIIDLDFVPYASIPRIRSYRYEPDYETGRRLLSDFDERFYELMRSRFIGRLDGINSRYESYQAQYCANRGISLGVFQGRIVSLSKPIGMGWHNVELSELGLPFVWSDSLTPTIELPVANAGAYVLYIYVQNILSRKLNLKISTLIGQSTFPIEVVQRDRLSIYKSCMTLPAADWIHCKFEVEDVAEAAVPPNGSVSLDERHRGIILVNAYLKRIPSA